MTPVIDPRKLKEKHYTTREAAVLLNVDTDTVKKYCQPPERKIKATKLFGPKGPWYIPQSSIDKYLADESTMGRPKKSRGRRKSA